jgi:SH3 domain protein
MRYRNFYLIIIELTAVIILGVLSTASIAAGSNTRYVTDELAVMMRTGKSNQHRIIRSLTSGTELRVLKYGKDYSRVKTGEGETGWVLTRYLVKSPVARTVLPPLQKRLETLESKNKELTEQLQETTRERDELKKIAARYELLESKHNELTAEAIELRQMVAKSSGLFETNETLTRKTKSLDAQVDVLMSEIRELSEGNDKLWFLTGSGVILVGFLAGAMLSRSRKPKQSSWASASDTLMLRQPSING